MAEQFDCPNGCEPIHVRHIDSDAPIRIPCGCVICAPARSCFTPLTTKVGTAAAKAVGINPGKAVDVNFEFGPPGHSFVVARYLLDDEAMRRVLEALAAIPLPAQR
ncbi:MAG: hypothetical protein ACD_23C01388G0003 [uncultured bacterium]|nr:MAG: hypothetical protein ACD_23C01388G0003 [uncultured bacterium]